MTYTEHDFSPESGSKKIVLTPDMISVTTKNMTKFCKKLAFVKLK